MIYCIISQIFIKIEPMKKYLKDNESLSQQIMFFLTFSLLLLFNFYVRLKSVFSSNINSSSSTSFLQLFP